jgi:hypothetical protein
MYRITCSFILILFSFNIQAAAQQASGPKQPQRLLYYIEDSKYTGFLVPYIETYLKNLSYQYKTTEPVFSEVISLNRLHENRKIEGTIIDAFIYADRKSTTLQNSRERDQRDAAIANSLLNYDRFLIIKINPFKELLEYQFLMFDVIKNKTPRVKDMPVLKSYRSSSTFINPTVVLAKEELAFAIKQVCPEVNESPVAQISINSKIPASPIDTVFVKVKDTLKIAAIAIDADSPNELFTYNWTMSDDMLYGQMSYGKANQKLVIDTPSVFNIDLVIHDGISQSQKTTITVRVIDPPKIEMGNSGNIAFLSDLPNDMFGHNLEEIRDDIKRECYYTSEYLFIKDIWGHSIILNGEDSLSIYFSNGNIRLKKSNAADSIIETVIRTNKITDTSSNEQKRHKNGYCALVRFYPEKKLLASSYKYTFYADDHHVESSNLNLKVSFIKIRQITFFNEYIYTWLGSRKGSLGNALLGIGWRPFGFLQINYAASRLFSPSRKVREREGDRIITGKLNSRLILEFLNPNKSNTVCFSVQMQQLNINADKEKRSDCIWGIGFRSTSILTTFGSTIDLTSGCHYFPNLTKRSYISDAGIFEFSMGLRLYFFQRR